MVGRRPLKIVSIQSNCYFASSRNSSFETIPSAEKTPKKKMDCASLFSSLFLTEIVMTIGP